MRGTTAPTPSIHETLQPGPTHSVAEFIPRPNGTTPIVDILRAKRYDMQDPATEAYLVEIHLQTLVNAACDPTIGADSLVAAAKNTPTNDPEALGQAVEGLLVTYLGYFSGGRAPNKTIGDRIALIAANYAPDDIDVSHPSLGATSARDLKLALAAAGITALGGQGRDTMRPYVECLLPGVDVNKIFGGGLQLSTPGDRLGHSLKARLLAAGVLAGVPLTAGLVTAAPAAATESVATAPASYVASTATNRVGSTAAHPDVRPAQVEVSATLNPAYIAESGSSSVGATETAPALRENRSELHNNPSELSSTAVDMVQHGYWREASQLLQGISPNGAVRIDRSLKSVISNSIVNARDYINENRIPGNQSSDIYLVTAYLDALSKNPLAEATIAREAGKGEGIITDTLQNVLNNSSFASNTAAQVNIVLEQLNDAGVDLSAYSADQQKRLAQMIAHLELLVMNDEQREEVKPQELVDQEATEAAGPQQVEVMSEDQIMKQTLDELVQYGDRWFGHGSSESSPTSWRGSYEALRFFHEHGFTIEQATGILGSLIVESAGFNLDPTITQRGGGPGFGIAQWGAWLRDASGNIARDAQGNKIRAGRYTGLVDFANFIGQPVDSRDTQFKYIMYEFEHSEARAFDKVREANTVREAAYAFMHWYERPRDDTSATRAQRGQAVLDEFWAVYNRIKEDNARAVSASTTPTDPEDSSQVNTSDGGVVTLNAAYIATTENTDASGSSNQPESSDSSQVPTAEPEQPPAADTAPAAPEQPPASPEPEAATSTLDTVPGGDLTIRWIDYFKGSQEGQRDASRACREPEQDHGGCDSRCARIAAVASGFTEAGGNAVDLRLEAAARGILHTDIENAPIGAIMLYDRPAGTIVGGVDVGKFDHALIRYDATHYFTNMTTRHTVEILTIEDANRMFGLPIGWVGKEIFDGQTPIAGYESGPPQTTA